MKRTVAATDGSQTASIAVTWAAESAARSGAELLLVKVEPPDAAPDGDGELAALAARLAGERGSAHVLRDADPARAIVDFAAERDADTIVVGNVAMRGRKEFLLGNVPNRVSHQARCTVVIVNTAGDAAPEPKQRAEEAALLARAATIARVAARHGLRGLLRRGEREGQAAHARQLREALEELGPTFSKLGQILSTRADLLPPAVIDELATLQDRVTPMPEAEVVAMMERELGVPWEDVFESIEAEPLAAGTIAQVHRATLAGGARVVCKVQRTNAEREIADDLGLLELFARRAEGRPAFREVVDVPAIIEHLSTSLRRELDFTQEAASIERLRQTLQPYPRLDVPAVHGRLSTRRLLVMEEVQGVPVREAPPGEARRQAARQLLEAYFRQILSDGFFHADPHPGNLKWWNERIYFLDLGMTGEIGAEVRELLLLVLLSFAEQDPEFLAEVILMLAGPGKAGDVDRAAFGADVAQLLERHRQRSLRDIAIGPFLEEMTEIALAHGVPMPASLTLAGKAFAQMQLAVGELDPELDAFKVAGDFVLRSLVGELRAGASPRRLLYEAQKVRLRLLRLGQSIEQIAGSRPGASLRVQFVGVEPLEQAVARAGRRAALGLVAAGALVATALIVRGDGASGRLPPPGR